MSGWQQLRAERNQRSLGRLTRALPPVFPRAVLTRALDRPFVPPTPRLAMESYAPIQFEPIAWREHLPLAAKRPLAGLGGWATAGAAYLSPCARHPHRSVNTRTPWGQDFAACAVNRSTASVGTLTCGAADPTRTPSGTVIALWRGSSGTRRVATSSCCGACKVGGVLKAVGDCGGVPKLTIASRCSGSGANTETRFGRDCSIFGDCQTFK
jgi:hypothetical protein